MGDVFAIQVEPEERTLTCQAELLDYLLEIDSLLPSRQKISCNSNLVKVMDCMKEAHKYVQSLPENDKKLKKKTYRVRLLLKTLVHDVNNSKTD